MGASSSTTKKNDGKPAEMANTRSRSGSSQAEKNKIRLESSRTPSLNGSVRDHGYSSPSTTLVPSASSFCAVRPGHQLDDICRPSNQPLGTITKSSGIIEQHRVLLDTQRTVSASSNPPLSGKPEALFDRPSCLSESTRLPDSRNLNSRSTTYYCGNTVTTATSSQPTEVIKPSTSSVMDIASPFNTESSLSTAFKKLETTTVQDSSPFTRAQRPSLPTKMEIAFSSAVVPKPAPTSSSDSSATIPNSSITVPKNQQTHSMGASLLDLLNQHQAAKDEAILMKKKAQEPNITPATNKPLFNKNKVPPAIREQQSKLPINAVKDQLIDAIKANQMVIVIGETGSGKSTQIPQYLVEAGLHGNGKIAVTQPRRVACKSLSTRVALECGVKLGTTVGYAVRFDKSLGGDTVIKYMTDGLLVRECATETNLDAYSIIIIDEAHERSIHTDVCFGLLKRAAERRPDLKIIISSATLEERKFSEYFNNAPVFKVAGKLHPVELVYNPKTEFDYMDGAVDTIININRSEGKGDILVFLSGQDEIEMVWDKLDNKLKDMTSSLYDTLIITPCCGAMPFEDQQKIFEETPANHQKVVLATNIAETSLTISGIKYVIDCGYFKQNEYNPKSGIYSLVRKRITKFQAIQRAGRAGRTQPGKCYRLYQEYDFKTTMQDANTPEITRCNVESVVLDIMSMGISNPLSFQFMDPPPRDAIMEALQHLKELSALDGDLQLTPLGRRMSEFPLVPQLAKVVIESEKLGCEQEVLKIVAMLSTQYHNIFSRNKKVRKQADESRKSFQSTDGDLLTLLKIFDSWVWNNYDEKWCWEMYLQYRNLWEAEEIRQQLEDILRSRGISQAANNRRVPTPPSASEAKSENIRRAFTAGFFKQLARKKAKGYAYETLGNLEHIEAVFLHPTCSLFSSSHPLVIYHEVLKTTKTFIRAVIKVESSWVKEYAPEFARKRSSYL